MKCQRCGKNEALGGYSESVYCRSCLQELYREAYHSKASQGEQGENGVSAHRPSSRKLDLKRKGADLADAPTQERKTPSPRNQKRADSLKGSFSDAFSSGKMAHPESLTKEEELYVKDSLDDLKAGRFEVSDSKETTKELLRKLKRKR